MLLSKIYMAEGIEQQQILKLDMKENTTYNIPTVLKTFSLLMIIQELFFLIGVVWRYCLVNRCRYGT